MEKNINETTEIQNKDTNDETIMNRVNQTFDRISQDVKDMINKNNQPLS